MTAALLGPFFLTRASRLLTFLSTSPIIFLYSCSAAFFPSDAFFAGADFFDFAFLIIFHFLGLFSDSISGLSTGPASDRFRFWVADCFWVLRMSARAGFSHVEREFRFDIGSDVIQRFGFEVVRL
jgi:hypothetical protein